MRQVAATAALTAAIVISGVVHGLWTDRWGRDASGVAARLPDRVGDWVGAAAPLEDEGAMARAGIRSYSAVRFVNGRTGHVIVALLVCGRPGQVAVHTPDVCYPNAGYELAGAPERVAVGQSEGGGDSLWRATARKRGALFGEELELLWGWRVDGNWSAAAYPRIEFARARYLFKLYLVRQTGPLDPPARAGLTVEFARDLLDAVRRPGGPSPDPSGR